MNMEFPVRPDESPEIQVDYEARPTISDTFEIYVDDDRYAVPTLHLVEALNATAAQAIAQRLIDDSPHHLGAEVCLEGQRVVGLGSFATRSLPPDVAFREPE